MSASAWNPEEYRRHVTTDDIVAAIECFLPKKVVPQLPVTICLEEAIKIIREYDGLVAREG